MGLLSLYERVEKFLARLPGPLRKPILREITPVKNLFLRKRLPRLALAGDPEADAADFIRALSQAHSSFSGALPAKSSIQWTPIPGLQRGGLSLLDARAAALSQDLRKSIGAELPDFLVFLWMGNETAAELEAALLQAASIVEAIPVEAQKTRPFFGLLLAQDMSLETEVMRNRLENRLRMEPALAKSLAGTWSLPPADAPDARRDAVEHLAQMMAKSLDDEAKIEMARLCGIRSLQAQVARTLTNSMTAIATAIGTQPIPLADLPFLTALQLFLVVGIVYISGREISRKLAGEFLAALGANVGAALVLREGSRALLKLFPGWGDAISGAIAGAGTYAIGKSATAYFIEGVSMKEARRLFQRLGARKKLPG